MNIENKHLSLTCIPHLGAKVSSIYCKKSNTELLWQSANSEQLETFNQFDSSGHYECFPNIDEETLNWKGKNYSMPDHGELWNQAWECAQHSNAITGKAKGRIWNYDFYREITLNENCIRFNYRITNNESFELPALWAFHPLFAVDEHSVIALEGCHKVELAHPDAILGQMETVVNFPITKEGVNLSAIRPISSKTSRKYYAYLKHSSGKASISLNNNRTAVALSFDPELCPYMGVWINEGGKNNAYNAALEPGTGYYDKVSIALGKQQLKFIAPGETLEFWVEMRVEEM